MSFLEAKRERDVKPTYKEANCAFPAHFHKNLEFLYPTGGEMVVLLGNERLTVPKHSLLIIGSLRVHHILTKETGISLCLPLSYLNDFFLYFKNKEFARVCIDDENGEIGRLLRSFECDRENELLEKARVNELLGFLVARVGLVEKREKTGADVVERAIAYINEHYESPLSLDLIASELSYSKYTISHQFKRETGMELREYINNVRLNEFVGRLRESKTSKKEKGIIEYSYDVGFGSVQSLYREFKKRYGISPERYRKELLVD